jgi:hypothetical protein
MKLTRRQLNLSIPATLGTALLTSRAGADQCAATNVALARGMEALARAYPDFIVSANEHEVLWKDGTRMPARLYPPNRPLEQQLNEPDLAAQVLQSYPVGPCALPMLSGHDPGRIRYQPFFAKMYGSTKAEVESNLRGSGWPSRDRHNSILLTSVNRVSFYIKRVAEELAALVNHYDYFDNPAGGYYWRNIAGTNRLSAHSYGIAVDINVNKSDYWRNEIPGTSGEPSTWQPRRKPREVPFEIVRIFERYGFIWGGKWHHYDTMHFEYRPEFFVER